MQLDNRFLDARLEDREQEQADDTNHENRNRYCLAKHREGNHRDGKQDAGQANGKRDAAEPVDMLLDNGARRLAQAHNTPDYSEYAYRNVEEEDPAPGRLRQQAANDRSQQEARGSGDLVDAQAKTHVPLAERVGDDGGAVRYHERATNTLHDTPEDEIGSVELRLRHTRDQRTKREHNEAAVVEPLTPPDISQPTNHRRQHGGNQQIAHQHPHDSKKGNMEIRQYIGQSNEQG